MFIEDLHVHTSFSFDAHAVMENLVIEAIEKNIDVLCFTDHIEVGPPIDSYATFDFSGRNAEFLRLKAKYGDKIKLLLGLEFGEPNLFENEKEKILAEYPYDMIIGSVHTPCESYFYGNHDMEKISREHYAHTLEMCKVGGFEVLGHLDFPKSFLDGFIFDIETSKEILRTCVKNNIVLEINTANLRRNKVQCPPMDLVEYYREVGGKYVTINSDTHESGSLAANYEKIYEALPKGLEIVYFEKRKMVVPKQR